MPIKFPFFTSGPRATGPAADAVSTGQFDTQRPGIKTTGFTITPSAVGTLARRTVQAVEPEAPRRIGQKFTDFMHGLSSVKTWVADHIIPSRIHANKVMANTKADMHQFMNMLAAQPGQVIDVLAIENLGNELKLNETALGKIGHDYYEMFRGTVLQQLESKNITELLALRRNLQKALKNLDERQTAAAHLRIVEQAIKKNSEDVDGVHQRVIESVLTQARTQFQPLFEEAIEAVSLEKSAPGSVEKSFRRLNDAAKTLLNSHELAGGKVSWQRALIKETITQLIDKGKLDASKVGSVVVALSYDTLKALYPKEDEPSIDKAQPPLNFNAIVKGAAGVRAERSEKAFYASVDKFLKQSTPPKNQSAAMKYYVDSLLEVQEHIAQHKKDSAFPGMDVLAGFTKKVAEFGDRLAKDLAQVTPQQFRALSTKDLLKLGVTLKEFHLGDAAKVTEAENQARSLAKSAAAKKEIENAVSAAASGNYKGVLIALHEFRSKADDALQDHLARGGKIRDADDKTNYVANFMTAALESIDTAKLNSLLTSLRSEDMTAFVDGLLVYGQELVSAKSDPAGVKEKLGADVLFCAHQMNLLDALAAEAAVKRKAVVPEKKSKARIENMKALAHKAINDVFGVIRKEGSEANILDNGPARYDVQKRFADYLQDLKNTPAIPALLADNSSTHIAQTAWGDLNRATFTIDGTLLIDRAEWGKADKKKQESMRADARTRLLEWVGGDQNRLLFVTHFTNQAILFPFMQTQTSMHTSAYLPDGRPGLPFSGDRGTEPWENVSYKLKKGANGAIELQVSYQANPNYFSCHGSGAVVKLDEGSTSQCTFGIRIEQNGEVSLSEPVSFLYKLSLAKEEVDQNEFVVPGGKIH